MKFAVLYHPEDISQVRLVYPLLEKVPDNMLRRFLPYLPPCSAGFFQNKANEYIGRAIICPLLPEHFIVLSSQVISQKINSCLKKAEKTKAQVIGLEGLIASYYEGGLLELKQEKLQLTTGLLLNTAAFLNKARRKAEQLGLDWAQNQIVLAGALGQEGETWIKLLAQEASSLVLTYTDAGWDKSFVSRIIYETGLAVKTTTNCGRALSQADIIFFHHLRPEDIKEAYQLKPGALVCSILPYSGWREKLQGRSDITYIEAPAYKSPASLIFTSKAPDYPDRFTSLAETLVLFWEQRAELNFPELKYSGRDITNKQIELALSLAKKYKLQL